MTACVFTEPINVPPNVEIVPPASLFRGVAAEFSARTTDDQREPPVLTWARHQGACPIDRSQAMWPAQRELAERYVVPPSETTRPFCVWAFATDSHGAIAAAAHDANPANHAPEAHIDVMRPEPGPSYPLFSDFRLSGSRSADFEQDMLTFEWRLFRAPVGSQAKLVPCDDGAGAMTAVNPQPYCFSADLPGDYQVQLTVTDLFNDHDDDIATFTVRPDRLPCFAQTQPDWASPMVVHAPDLPDTFKVLAVDDDGDPLPAGPRGMAHFVWGIARGDGPMTHFDRDIPWYDIPQGTFEFGDTVRVRVEVYDRNVSVIDRILLSCGDDDLCTERPGSQCFQRITWKIEYR